MEKKIVEKTVYVADDGEEFSTEKECLNHEELVREVYAKIKYFCVHHSPDLTETGLFQGRTYVAVFTDYYHKELVYQWAFKKIGAIIGPSVMGYGFQSHFAVYEIDKKQYDDKMGVKWGGVMVKADQILLSPSPIKGFPENYDYIEEFGIGRD